MDEILDAIKARIEECKSSGDSFTMPVLDRDDVTVERNKLEPSGSVLFHEEYKITLPDGSWITIDSQSKDKCRTFQVNPDRSYVTVKCSDPSKDFIDAWNERV